VARQRQISDHFTKRAKQQSYPARSIFKLEEIDQKHRVFAPGHAVLDLGCAPGSWLLYASQRVGPAGLVVGVDRHSLKIGVPANARYLCADALTIDRATVAAVRPEPFDVVLSDMAPHTSGNRFVDQQRSLRLFLRALDLAVEYSRAGATFVGKVFQSEDVDGARARAGELFRTVRVLRPKATKKQSYEVYVLCMDRLPAPARE
jgi:23S rRNA (uridine2552-2'-O)-methyltransferase